MIDYISSRGDRRTYTFSQSILQGPAPDGGLLCPEKLPVMTQHDILSLMKSSYAQKALFLFQLFQTDIPQPQMKKIAEKAYGKNSKFPQPFVVPLKHLKENEYILELWHGPTCAFKDLALQILPHVFSYAVSQENRKRKRKGLLPKRYVILTTTSGDTGKAALEGYKDKKNISLMVFFPHKHVSPIQELAMTTQPGKNVGVYPVQGTFDEVTKSVKSLFHASRFQNVLEETYHTSLSAANSINWGRVLPQIIYYVSSYIELLEKNVLKPGDPIDVAIPTGNFGNILASFLAKQIGLPIRKFICASNENNVLTQFLTTGIFDVRNKQLKQTPSPAMDILLPSNHERLLYFLTKDPYLVSDWMKQCSEKKIFSVDAKTKQMFSELFYADWVSNAQTLKTIHMTYQETGYLLDPHTAVVKTVVNRYVQTTGTHVPILLCATAHWAKFPSDVYAGLYERPCTLNEFDCIRLLKKQTASRVPVSLISLQKKPVRFRKKILPRNETMKKTVYEFLKTQANL